MDPDVQQGIMTAIQELPGIEELAGGSLVPNSDSFAVMTGRSPNQTTNGPGFQNLLSQLEAANEERKLLAKERQKLNLQVCAKTSYLLYSTSRSHLNYTGKDSSYQNRFDLLFHS